MRAHCLRRRRMVGGLAAAAAAPFLGGAAMSPSLARADCCSTSRGPRDRRDPPQNMRTRFPLPGGGRFLPTRLVLAGPTQTLSAALPSRVDTEDANKLPLGRAPLFDQLLERPLLDFIAPETRIGGVFRVGDALVARFPDAERFAMATARLTRPPAIVTKPPRGSRVLYFAPPLRFEAADPPAGGLGDPVGWAYAAGDVLAISPPRKALVGFKLF